LQNIAQCNVWATRGVGPFVVTESILQSPQYRVWIAAIELEYAMDRDPLRKLGNLSVAARNPI
jgi:hypothetical protein